MTQSDSTSSPYAPIRLRSMFWWEAAINFAKEGLITRNGMIGSHLPELIMQEVVAPAAQQALNQDTPSEILYPVFAALLEFRHWIPLIGQYELSGRQIFDLSDTLVTMLAHTDVEKVTLEDWHAPYDCFYVRFGKRDDLALPFDEDGIMEYVDGAFIATTPINPSDPESIRRLKIGLTTVKDNGEGTMIHGHFIDLNPEELLLSVPDAIDAALTRKMEEYANQADPENFSGLSEFRADVVREHFELFKNASSLVVNALFYIESLRGERKLSPGRDVPPSLHSEWANKPAPSRRKTTSKLTRLGYSLVYMLGSEVEGGSSQKASGSKKVHWVRGHLRNQAYGKGRTLRRIKWIKPYIAGTKGDIDEASGHIYKTAPSSDSMQ